MDRCTYFMALQLSGFHRVTVGDRIVQAVPGDILLDSPDGDRKLLTKIAFESFVEEGNYLVGGDVGMGWQRVTKT